MKTSEALSEKVQFFGGEISIYLNRRIFLMIFRDSGTCICCKMFEHIIVSSMMRHLDKHDTLTDCQHGFRLRRSCETEQMTLTDELIKSLGNSRQHVLDFSKAFDRVYHERLLIKLEHYDIRGRSLNWIRAFLTDKSERVTVERVASEPARVKSGVPKGSVLVPVLFLVFINDLPVSIRSNSRLFSDDCSYTGKSDQPTTVRSFKMSYSSYGNGKNDGACLFTRRSAASSEFIESEHHYCLTAPSRATFSSVKNKPSTLG